MDTSIFLAQAMGLFLIILAFAMFIQKDRFIAIVANVIENPGMLFFMSLNFLVIGILLVLTHNIWDSSWRVVITILAWLTLFRAVLNLCFPSVAISLTEKVVLNSNKIMVASAINLLLGLFLCYMGFGTHGRDLTPMHVQPQIVSSSL